MTDFTTQQKGSNELVNNGAFAGSADFWILGEGWSYSANSIVFNFLGSEIILNGGFTGNADNWTLVHALYGTNNVLVGSDLSTNPKVIQAFAFTQGKKYRITFDYGTSVSGQMTGQLATGGPGGGFTVNKFADGLTFNGSGTFSIDYIPPSTALGSQGIRFFTPTSGGWQGSLDNISVKPFVQGVLSQNIAAINGKNYPVKVTVTGTVGSVTVSLGGTSFVVLAGTTGNSILSALGGAVNLTPSSDFNGAVSNVSVGVTSFANPSSKHSIAFSNKNKS